MASEVDELTARAPADPRGVLDDATALLGQPLTDRHRAVVLRARGLAHRYLGEVDRAIEDLESAFDTARSVDDNDTAGWSMLNLAGTLAMAGRHSDALTLLDRSAGLVPPQLEPQFHLQRGNLLGRTVGRAQAIAEFDLAYDGLSRSGATRELALLLNNRGLLKLWDADVDGAEADLREAQQLAIDSGDDIRAVYAEHNLGMVAATAGDLIGALRLFEHCEPEMERLVGASWEPGRCETLLAAGLFEEAYEVANEAIAVMEPRGLTTDLAEVVLVAAEASLLSGATERAVDLAARASDLFAQQERHGWVARSLLVSLAADELAGRVTPEDAEAVARTLRESGLGSATPAAKAVAVRARARAGATVAAVRDLHELQAENPAPPLDVVIDLRSAEVEVQLAQDDKAGASRTIARTLRAVAHAQETVGATDVRSGLPRHAQRLAERGLELAVESGRPRRVWEWLERGRATALRFRPVRTARDPELARLMTELRLVAKERREASEDDALLATRQAKLEQRVLRHWRSHAATREAAQADGGPVDRALNVLGDCTLIEIGVVRGEVIGVVARRGRCSLERLGPVESWGRELRALSSSLRRCLVGRLTETRLTSLRAMVEDMGAPLRALTHGGPAILVPPASLAQAPWTALLRPSPVVVAPSTELWLRANSVEVRGAPVVAVAGSDLAHSRLEVDAIARLYREDGGFHDVGADDLANLLDGAGVAHLACHGRFRKGQPMLTGLLMADGEMYLHQWHDMADPPSTVILSACDTGRFVETGNEMLGMASVMLSAGTRTVVASPQPVPDSEQLAALMLDLHHSMLNGIDPATFLARISPGSQERVLADAFNTYGAF